MAVITRICRYIALTEISTCVLSPLVIIKTSFLLYVITLEDKFLKLILTVKQWSFSPNKYKNYTLEEKNKQEEGKNNRRKKKIDFFCPTVS